MDIETLGLSPKCGVLELAFVEVDLEDVTTDTKDLPTYVLRLKPEGQVEAPALAMHIENGLLSLCCAEGIPAQEAWVRIAAYLDNYLVRTGQRKVTFVGKNVAGFDLRFFPEWVKQERVHYRTLDVGSMCVEAADIVVPSLNVCLTRHGFGAGRDHTALADALDVARVLRARFTE
jgi:oligoribonuclease (3'-5' exoribonuclease)